MYNLAVRRILSVLVIGILLVINFNLLKSSYESATKLSQINGDQDKIKELEKVNVDLKSQLKETDSTFFVEKEARDKLGLGKQGEVAVVVEGATDKSTSKEESQPLSNFQKWLKLLKI